MKLRVHLGNSKRLLGIIKKYGLYIIFLFKIKINLISIQLIMITICTNDIFSEFPEESVSSGSKYLSKKTFESLNELFTASQEIQDWLTECAKV